MMFPSRSQRSSPNRDGTRAAAKAQKRSSGSKLRRKCISARFTRGKSRRCKDKRTACLGKSQVRYQSGQQYSIIALTDSSATIKERYAYSAYGTPTINDASGTVRSSTAEGNRCLYTGREYDDVTDTYHYRARIYLSRLGRFGSRDPIGYEDGENLFRYASSNPIRYIDPLGNEIRLPDDVDGPTNENPGRALCRRIPGHQFVRVFAYKWYAENGCNCKSGMDRKCVDLHFDIVQGRSVMETTGDTGTETVDCPLHWVPATGGQNESLVDYYSKKMKCGEGMWFTYSLWNSCLDVSARDVYFGVPKVTFNRRKCIADCCGENGCRGSQNRVCSRRCDKEASKHREKCTYRYNWD